MQPRAFDVLGTTELRERLALLHAAVLLPGSREGVPASLPFEIFSRGVDPAVIAEARQLGVAWIAHCAHDR